MIQALKYLKNEVIKLKYYKKITLFKHLCKNGLTILLQIFEFA